MTEYVKMSRRFVLVQVVLDSESKLTSWPARRKM